MVGLGAGDYLRGDGAQLFLLRFGVWEWWVPWKEPMRKRNVEMSWFLRVCEAAALAALILATTFPVLSLPCSSHIHYYVIQCTKSFFFEIIHCIKSKNIARMKSYLFSCIIFQAEVNTHVKNLIGNHFDLIHKFELNKLYIYMKAIHKTFWILIHEFAN